MPASLLFLLAHTNERTIGLEDNITGGAEWNSFTVDRQAVGTHTRHVNQCAMTEAGGAVIHCVGWRSVELLTSCNATVVHEQECLKELRHLCVWRGNGK